MINLFFNTSWRRATKSRANLHRNAATFGCLILCATICLMALQGHFSGRCVRAQRLLLSLV